MRITDDTIYWNKGDVFPLSAHFSSAEFTCSCKHTSCTEQKASKKLLGLLEQVRKDVDAPVRINSGFRCAAKQQDLRAAGYETAAGTSQHELGNAADLQTADMASLLRACKAHFQAVGAANSFVHVDTRSDKVRYWSYSKP